jgi:tRNA-binding EMAP/Myf-like protein
MQQVPEQQGGFVRVPKISTGADSASAAASGTSSVDSAASTASTASWSSRDEEAASAAARGDDGDVSGPISADELALLQALDVRVGRIISCEQHPDADRCDTWRCDNSSTK